MALWDKPRRGGIPKLDERGRATLIALACANPPGGRTRWTMQLLANELVVRQVVPSISDETVRGEPKKRPEAVAPGALVHSGGQPELS